MKYLEENDFRDKMFNNTVCKVDLETETLMDCSRYRVLGVKDVFR